jgi:hypothetical protein
MPAKDRDGIHVSMPKEMKDAIIRESERRKMYVSDVICEKIEYSYNRETQAQTDLLHLLEAMSRKIDQLVAHHEKESKAEVMENPPKDFHYRLIETPVAPPVVEESSPPEPQPRRGWLRR